MKKQTSKYAKTTRFYRAWHRKVAIIFLIFILLMSITGVLLGLKKKIYLSPKTQKSERIDKSKWLSIQELESVAQSYIEKQGKSNLVKRIDVRPQKGIAKILFEDQFKEIQIDLTSGKVLSYGFRGSDFVEALHDGSIVDEIVDSGGLIKVLYSFFIGIVLVFLSYSGFRIWINRRSIRKIKNKE